MRAYQAVYFNKINCCEFFYLKIGPFFNNVDEIGISMIHTMACDERNYFPPSLTSSVVSIAGPCSGLVYVDFSNSFVTYKAI